VGESEEISTEVRENAASGAKQERRVLVVDDSSVALKQVKRTLVQIGLESVMAKNGREALDLLHQWVAEGSVYDHISLVISDIEMPEMDGYTLTREVRSDPELQNLYILLHTSLSGVFNNAMVEKVGADRFVAKFSPDELATGVLDALGDPA